MNQKMQREEGLFQGIPYSIVYNENSLNKPVIFFFHGFQSNRVQGPMGREETLTKMGLCVVMMDAYYHGDRKDSTFEELDSIHKHMKMIDIELHTANDAIQLYEELIRQNKISSDTPLLAYGVSMGAATALYLASIYPKLEMVVSIVGAPSLLGFYELKHTRFQLEKDDIYYQNIKKYEQEDPLIHYRRLEKANLFLAVGLTDDVVPLQFAKSLSMKLKVSYREYDTGHLSTKEMLEDGYRFILAHLEKISWRNI